jgi:hypothetical protein
VGVLLCGRAGLGGVCRVGRLGLWALVGIWWLPSSALEHSKVSTLDIYDFLFLNIPPYTFKKQFSI